VYRDIVQYLTPYSVIRNQYITFYYKKAAFNLVVIIRFTNVTTIRIILNFYKTRKKIVVHHSHRSNAISIQMDKRKGLGIASWIYRGADKSLTRRTSRCILFDGENISFDDILVIYINSTNIPPIMIKNRIYETQNLLSL